MREFKLVEAALHAMGDDEDIVKVITDGQNKSTIKDMKNMEDANSGVEDPSEKMVRFSTKNEAATIQIKGEKEKGNASNSQKANT